MSSLGDNQEMLLVISDFLTTPDYRSMFSVCRVWFYTLSGRRLNIGFHPSDDPVTMDRVMRRILGAPSYMQSLVIASWIWKKLIFSVSKLPTIRSLSVYYVGGCNNGGWMFPQKMEHLEWRAMTADASVIPDDIPSNASLRCMSVEGNTQPEPNSRLDWTLMPLG